MPEGTWQEKYKITQPFQVRKACHTDEHGDYILDVDGTKVYIVYLDDIDKEMK